MRAAARAVVDKILERLANPVATAAATQIPAKASDDGRAWPVWEDLSLASGYPGVSLAFSGTASRGDEHPLRAHRYLVQAQVRAMGAAHTATGIYAGPGALAVAILVAHQATGGYDQALAQLDAYQRRLARSAIPAIGDAPVATNGVFETVRGLTGVGRYLLARPSAGHQELALILNYLVAMTGQASHRGNRVPRWWTLAAPVQGKEDAFPDGHLNLGLSHGISGPLALLALAWRAGVIVDGHEAAIESLVALLKRWAVRDESGVHWPDLLTFEEWTSGHPRVRQYRPSWCYGAPGVSRAVQLAALALDRPDWHDLAHASVLGFLGQPREAWGVQDGALCHGWGGLLHLVRLLNEHLHDDRLTRAADDLAATLINGFDEDAPFGYRSSYGADLSGFLDGAAGVALALDDYAEDHTTAGWDMALLVA